MEFNLLYAYLWVSWLYYSHLTHLISSPQRNAVTQLTFHFIYNNSIYSYSGSNKKKTIKHKYATLFLSICQHAKGMEIMLCIQFSFKWKMMISLVNGVSLALPSDFHSLCITCLYHKHSVNAFTADRICPRPWIIPKRKKILLLIKRFSDVF